MHPQKLWFDSCTNYARLWVLSLPRLSQSNYSLRRAVLSAKHFSSIGPLVEWHQQSYLQPAKSKRRTMLVLFLVLWIAVCDLCLPLTNVAILYIAPLVLMSLFRADSRAIWRLGLTTAVLTYAVYFLKNTINPYYDTLVYFDYRLVNRSLVVLVLLSLAGVLQIWLRTREDEQDAELPDHFRQQDREIGSTIALLLCVPMVIAIAIADFFAPANFNLAILYPLPLFICCWTRSRSLLWSVFVVLAVCAVFCFVWGGQPLPHHIGASLVRNRILAIISLTAVASVLDYWLTRESC